MNNFDNITAASVLRAQARIADALSQELFDKNMENCPEPAFVAKLRVLQSRAFTLAQAAQEDLLSKLESGELTFEQAILQNHEATITGLQEGQATVQRVMQESIMELQATSPSSAALLN